MEGVLGFCFFGQHVWIFTISCCCLASVSSTLQVLFS